MSRGTKWCYSRVACRWCRVRRKLAEHEDKVRRNLAENKDKIKEEAGRKLG
jgi:hypothetical protein